MQKRCKPHILLAYEALFRRLKKRYRKNEILLSNYWRYKIGYQGEQKVDYQLSLFPNSNFFHLPNLRLEINQHFFQIDSLIITPKLIFIIEIKNMKGTLEYSPHYGQLIQTNDGKAIGYSNPLSQVNIQKQHLSQWLHQLNYDLPIETFVTSTNPQAVIRNTYEDELFKQTFISLDHLLDKLNKTYDAYHKKIVAKKDIHSLARKFSQNNTFLMSNLIEQHDIQSHHLLEGVPCDECERTLQWWRRSWYCPSCRISYPNQHVQAIYDYFLLHQSYLTNERCRHFLQLPNSDTTYKILLKMNLKSTGKNKGKKYLSPHISKFPQNADPFLNTFSILDR